MAIDPRLIPGTGGDRGKGQWKRAAANIADLQRRIGALEAARTVIQPASLTGDQLANGTITATQILAGTITSAEIAAGSITAALIGAGAINAGHMSADSVTATAIAAGAVVAGKLAANSVATANLQAGAVTAGKIAAATITSNEIAAGTITAGNIAANTITGANIAAGTITATNIVAGTITNSLIATGTLTGDRLVANTIDATKLTISQLSAITSNMGSLTAGTITGGTIQSASSGARWVGDSVGLRGFDASSNITFAFDIATGKITTIAGLGGPNLASESSFETVGMPGYTTGSSWFTNAASSFTRITSDFWHGGASAEVVTTATTSFQGFYRNQTGKTYRAGQPYTFSAWIKSVSGSTGLNLFVGETGTANNANLNVTAVAGSWRRFSVVWTPTADVATVYFGVRTSSAAVATFRVDALQLEEGSILTAYGPRPDEVLPGTVRGGNAGSGAEIATNTIIGTDLVTDTVTAREIAASTVTAVEIAARTITAGNIKAGELTAAEILSGTITSQQIAANTIGTDQLDATAINGMVITGATIQTAASGSRVVVNTEGISAFDASSGADILTALIPSSSGQTPFFAGQLFAKGGLQFTAPTTSPASGAAKARWLRASDNAELASLFGSPAGYGSQTAAAALRTSVTTPLSYKDLILAHANLVHYWRANSTGTWTDQKGSLTLSSAGSGSGEPTAVPALISSNDQATSCPEVAGGDTVYFSGSPGVTENVTNGLSFETWIRFNAAPTNTINIYARGPIANPYWSLRLRSDRKLEFRILVAGTQRSSVSTTVLPVDTVAHVVCTYDGANMRIWINGVSEPATAQTGNIDAQTTSAYQVGGIEAAGGNQVRSPTAASADTGGAATLWNNVNNILAADAGTQVTASNSAWNGGQSGLSSYFMYATAYGFSVPAGVNVNGIKARIGRSRGNSAAVRDFYDTEVRLTGTGVTSAANRAKTGITWPKQAAPAYAVYGSASDLWGETSLPAATVNGSTFGLKMAVAGGDATVGYVDYIELTAYWGGNFTLIVDEPAVYNAALTSTVIGDHFNTGMTGASSVSSVQTEKVIIDSDNKSDFLFVPKWITPVTKVTSGSGNVARTTVSVATDTGADTAIIAILEVELQGVATGAAYKSNEYRIWAGPGGGANDFRTAKHWAAGTVGTGAGTRQQMLVPLDASENFDYQKIDGIASSSGGSITLIGYI
jgi:hypothetical protein